jgi:hypothetical protein
MPFTRNSIKKLRFDKKRLPNLIVTPQKSYANGFIVTIQPNNNPELKCLTIVKDCLLRNIPSQDLYLISYIEYNPNVIDVINLYRGGYVVFAGCLDGIMYLGVSSDIVALTPNDILAEKVRQEGKQLLNKIELQMFYQAELKLKKLYAEDRERYYSEYLAPTIARSQY